MTGRRITTRKSRSPKATTQLAIRFPNEALKAVDEIVASRSLEGVDRSTVIRELLAEALKARGKR
jgi:hypothetical protein